MRRIRARLPSLARTAATLSAVAATAALVALLQGPWLRVADVGFAGQHYTDPNELRGLLAAERGTSLLAVDTRSIAERIETLPAVAHATVTAGLLGHVGAEITEHEPAFLWHTSSGAYLGAGDGTIFAAFAGGATPVSDVASLPQIRDERAVARHVTVGDVIPAGLLATALRVLAIEPATLGSAASGLSLRLDDAYGFRVASAAPEWEIAFGAYGVDPSETSAEAAARLDRQVAAVRTLFAQRPEAEIGWVDVRNPGKVYFRAKG